MTGIFATRAVNSAGNDGLFYGNSSLLVTQIIAVAITVAFAAVGTAVILLVLKAVMGLRVTATEEQQGLDLSQHSESAYVFTPDYDEGSTAMHSHSGSAPKAVTSKA